MLKVILEPTVLSPGNALSVVVCGIEDITHVVNMTIWLGRIDKDYTMQVLGWGGKPSVRDDVLTVSTAHTGDLQPRIHEVSAILVSYTPECTITEATFVCGRDFERIFLDVVPTGSEGRTQEVLKQELLQMMKAYLDKAIQEYIDTVVKKLG